MSKNTEWLQAALRVAAAVLIAKRDLESLVGPVTFTRDSQNICVFSEDRRLIGQGMDHIAAIAAARAEVKQ